MRRYPYELKWSARRVSIEIKMTEAGSAARHSPPPTPSNVSHRNRVERNHQPPATNHQPRRAKRAPYDFGITFPGSTNGIGTTTARADPLGVSTSSFVPSAAYATGIIA